MHEGVRTGGVIHSARAAGGGAGLSVTVGSRSRGTRCLAAEPSGVRATGHYPRRHAVTRRRTARTPYQQEHGQDSDHQRPLWKA